MRFEPLYNTETFVKVWKSATDFSRECLHSDLPMALDSTDLSSIYYLLYAKYGNNPIANMDVFQFKYKVFSILYTYGAEWKKKKEIQKKLQDLSEEDIMSRGIDIFNHASNPSTAPSTIGTDELKYVDSQSVSKKKVAKITAYQFWWESLESNMDEWLVKKFESCFSKFVYPNCEVKYPKYDEEE